MPVHGGEKETIDEEWVELLKEAFTLGLSVEEVRSFFKKSASEQLHHDHEN